MEKLTDFKPLAKVLLPDIGELDTRGLIVLVGPNSSGKTRLLRDIYSSLSGTSQNDLVVAKRVIVAKPSNFEDLIRFMVEEGYVQIVMDGGRRSRTAVALRYLAMRGVRQLRLDPNFGRDLRSNESEELSHASS